jgi:hypothetical protein
VERRDLVDLTSSLSVVGRRVGTLVEAPSILVAAAAAGLLRVRSKEPETACAFGLPSGLATLWWKLHLPAAALRVCSSTVQVRPMKSFDVVFRYA